MLEFEARIAARGFDVRLSVASGETLAILGPNGAGKSTLLNVIAGLIKPDSGRARLEEIELFDLGQNARGVWVAPHARGVSLLAQEALLFPHLSALDNVAFGPASAGAGKRAARDQAIRWLREVEAVELAERKPAQLSGGQAQRVAVARALASDPRLLLLDEPMSALDVTITPMLRRMLRSVLGERTVILVTHDVLDAYTLADRVAVMKDGEIVESGPTREVLERPRTAFTAALVARNLLIGTRTATGLRTAAGLDIAVDPVLGIPDGTAVAATVPPSAIRLQVRRPAGETNVFEGEITDLEPRGDLIRVHLGGLFCDVQPGIAADLDLAPGSRAWLGFDPADALMYAL